MSSKSKQAENRLQWQGIRQGFYEVYYLKWNDPKSETAAWVRYTLTSPIPKLGAPYCELWGIFFDAKDPGNNFAVKNRFPISDLSWHDDPFSVRINDAELSQNAAHATITDKNGRYLTWHLNFDSIGETHRYFPSDRFYKGAFPKSKGLSPHCNGRFTGSLDANGRVIGFTNVPGQQTHIWGTKHALRWAWGHCNAFAEDPDAVWEGLTAQIKLGPVASPKINLFYLRYKGKTYRFNGPSDWLTNKAQWELGKWRFSFRNDEIKVTGEIEAPYESFVAVTYTDPDGEKLWCNNCKVAPIKLQIFDNRGVPMGELTSKNSCAVEFVDRKTYDEVPVRI
jgi:Tocopherol cyclase